MTQKLTANQARYRREVARVGRARMREIWRAKARARRGDPDALMTRATRQLTELSATREKLSTAVTTRLQSTR